MSAIDRKIRVSRDCILLLLLSSLYWHFCHSADITATVTVDPIQCAAKLHYKSLLCWQYCGRRRRYTQYTGVVVVVIYYYNIMRCVCVRIKMRFTVADRLLRQTRREAWCICCCCRFVAFKIYFTVVLTFYPPRTRPCYDPARNLPTVTTLWYDNDNNMIKAFPGFVQRLIITTKKKYQNYYYGIFSAVFIAGHVPGSNIARVITFKHTLGWTARVIAPRPHPIDKICVSCK